MTSHNFCYFLTPLEHFFSTNAKVVTKLLAPSQRLMDNPLFTINVFQLLAIDSKLSTISLELEDVKSSTKTIETSLEQKIGQTSTELKCIKTDLSAFNQVNKDFLHVVKVNIVNIIKSRFLNFSV